MIEKSFIPEELRSFNYYVDKLPLYLQQSFGFIEHYRIWYDLLISESPNSGLDKGFQTIFNFLNIFDNDYLNYINSFTDSDSGTKSEMLDMIGSLFGVTRNFTITYYDPDDTQTHTESLTLNNKDFLVLVKTQVVKNYCDGSYETIRGHFENIKLQLYPITDSTNSSKVILYLITSEGGQTYDYSENIRKMFLAGMLNIESMGILYQPYLLNLALLGYWDTTTSLWDTSQWGA